MPKFSALTWAIIVVGQIIYGLTVFAVTRNHYQDAGMTASVSPVRENRTTMQPQPSSFNTSLQPDMSMQSLADELASNDPAMVIQLANDYFAQKSYKKASELYERALKFDPENVATYNELGLSLFYAGDSKQAVEVLQTGASKQPGFQRIQLTLGFVLAQTGDQAAAADSLRKAISLDPESTIGQEAKRILSQIE